MTLRDLMTEVARERGLDDADIKIIFERAALRVPIQFNHEFPPDQVEGVKAGVRRMMGTWAAMSRPEQLALMRAVEDKVAKDN